jgi:hypothetical protein
VGLRGTVLVWELLFIVSSVRTCGSIARPLHLVNILISALMEHIQCQHCGNAIPQPQYQEHLLTMHPQDQTPAPQEEKAPVQSQPQENTNGQDLASNQPVQSDNIENPQDIPQIGHCELCGKAGFNLHSEEFQKHLDEHKADRQPISQEEVVHGEVVTEKHAGGRPSKYNEGKLDIATKYVKDCINANHIPYIEELALLCDVDDTTLLNWCDYKENKEFLATIKRLKTLQKFRLMQRVSSPKGNPTGSIFILKANHNMIETEKRILAGEKNAEPMQVSVTSYADANKQIPSEVQQAIIEEVAE